MAKKRKPENRNTTISVSWIDKELFRKFAKFVKKTKHGQMYEPDYIVFNRMLEEYSRVNAPIGGGSTYPSVSLNESQQG